MHLDIEWLSRCAQPDDSLAGGRSLPLTHRSPTGQSCRNLAAPFVHSASAFFASCFAPEGFIARFWYAELRHGCMAARTADLAEVDTPPIPDNRPAGDQHKSGENENAEQREKREKYNAIGNEMV